MQRHTEIQKIHWRQNSESMLTSAELFMLIGDLLGFTKIHMEYKYKDTKKTKRYIGEKFREQADQCRAAHDHWRLAGLYKNTQEMQ